jgi:hypothetical protein
MVHIVMSLLGGRLTVRLRTLDPPIGVRIPASQLFFFNDLRFSFSRPFSIVLETVPETLSKTLVLIFYCRLFFAVSSVID